jgi:hypothetical protein
MSLHALAGHMAAKGRNGDSMLVHMTPGEVQALQALAERNGGTLTINPETGQPEANFLKKMLPMIAGFALGPAGFGLMSAGMAGAAVGGITALSTGSLSRGLMAGLGAYGGASLGASLAGAGQGAIAAGDIAAQQAAGTFPALAEGAGAEQIAKYAADVGGLRDAALSKAGEAGFGAKMSAGFGQMASNPGAYTKEMMTGLAAISPMMADQGVQTTTKRPDTGTIRNFTFDPYGQTYTSAGNYPASEYKGMAQGGIVALAEGGTPGSIEDLYKQYAGRGSDPEGLKYWQQQFGDTIDPNEVNVFKSSVAAARAQGTEPLAQPAAPSGLASLGNVGDMSYVARDPGVITATNQYFAQNPDVAAAYANRANDPNLASTVNMTPEQFAQVHSSRYGSAEQRATPLTAASNSNAYLMANPDVAAEYAANSYGMTPQQIAAYHSNTYGNKEQRATPLAAAEAQVTNMYRNVLGRDPDPTGLQFWSSAIAAGRSPESIYNEFLTSARANTELVREDQIKNKSFTEAIKPYAGYMSAEGGNIADEWVRNVLGREPTARDKAQSWYQDTLTKMTTQAQARDLYNKFLASAAGEKGAKTDLNWMAASQLNPLARPVTTPQTYAPEGTSNPYGNPTNPGDQTFNRDGSITVQPNIPGRPYGGFSGMGQVRDAYTQGGGSLGYVNPAPKTMEEFDQRFNSQTGDSLAAYNYLMGKGANPIKSGVGEIMRPYSEAVRGVPAAEGRPTQRYIYQDGRYVENPNYRPMSFNSKGERMVGMTSTEVIKGLQGLKDPADDGALFDFVTDNRISEAQLAAALGISIAEARARIAAGKKRGAGNAAIVAASAVDPNTQGGANGGLMGMAAGGYAVGGGLGALAGGGATSQYNLGGYSDGGRLLRGPGDGVSDSIPATIGDKQPARLADGEFVVPARIVSELGNGSTEAGARKLYAMMDRVQKARGKTTGKNRVAANTRSEKHLPA